MERRKRLCTGVGLSQALREEVYPGNYVAVLGFVMLLVMAGLLAGGCSDRVKGSRTANVPPVVYFVNIPPEGYRESFNDVIHWVGSDCDGRVVLFRYVVVKASFLPDNEAGSVNAFARDLQFMSPGDSSFVLAGDTLHWTYLPVTIDNPQSSQIVPMSASITNPVMEFVPQYVFLQAFDDGGLSSEVVFKLILRNDYPPDTRIFGIDSRKDYINAAKPGGVNTGIPVNWEGSDPDAEDTSFQFEWRLYGPYRTDTVNGDFFEEVIDSFVKLVFVTHRAELYPRGLDTFFYLLDSQYVCDTVTDTCAVEVDSQIVFVDSLNIRNSSQWSVYGRFDTLLDVADVNFANNAEINLLRQSSDGWATAFRDTLYDVFPTPDDPAADTTRSMAFIFWVRSRDAAQVMDLTPAFVKINVIQPKYERDILVIDFSKMSGRINAPYKSIDFSVDTAVHYWDRVIHAWKPDTDFDITPLYNEAGSQIVQYVDYVYANKTNGKIPLQRMLQHKVLVLYNDDIVSSGISQGLSGQPTTLGRNIYITIESGVNCWLTMRAPIYGDLGYGPRIGSLPALPDADYCSHFGIDPNYGLVYSGWGYHAMDLEPDSIRVEIDTVTHEYDWIPNPRKRPHRRIEDFIGAVSLNDGKWPDLEVDTALLHRRYYWFPDMGAIKGLSYDDSLPMSITTSRVFKPADLHALPEVNWASRIYGTEGMYLYKSFYGLNHPLGFEYSFDGSPVAHRYDAGLYRTAHFCFTPLAIADEGMQVVVDTVLTWLYPAGGVTNALANLRPAAAAVSASAARARSEYWRKFGSEIEEDKIVRPTGEKLRRVFRDAR